MSYRRLLLATTLLAASPWAWAQDIPRNAWAQCRALPEAARLACYDGLGGEAARPAAAAAPAAAPAAAVAPAAPATFGLPQRRAEPAEISTQTEPGFKGWGPGSRIRLANGQLWQVVDRSEAELRAGARAVRVERTLFGDYQLVVEGINTAPKVRRLE